MKLTAGEFISKAEGLKSSEISARQRIESIESRRSSVRSAIETEQLRIQRLSLELQALESQESDEDGEGADHSDRKAAIMAEIEIAKETIESYETRDAELGGEQAEAEAELRSIEIQEQQTLSEIADSAARVNQNIALISAYGGDYAKVSSQAASAFQHNLGQLSQAAQILGGNVPTGTPSGAGRSTRGSSSHGGSASRGSDGSSRNFYETANNQRNSGMHVAGSMGTKPANSGPSGRNKQALVATSTPESEESKKSGGLGKRPTKQTPFQALAAYMNAHNYGQDDFATYSEDPEWRVLQRRAYPNYEMPLLSKERAKELLNQYMNERNYGEDDFYIYCHDPIWRELHRYAFPGYSASLKRPDITDTDNVSSQYVLVRDEIDSIGIQHRAINAYGRNRSSEEIVSRLSGGDNTKGACSSLAFAYAGNRAGYDVLDFRGGNSCEFFASNRSIQMIADLPGVKSNIIYGRNDLLCANTLLDSMDDEKEYYLATGVHATIVRRHDGRLEYLELQSSESKENGWHGLNDYELIIRFNCVYEEKEDCPNFLIDVESLSESSEFLDILGYINTANGNQKKGKSGHER